MPMKKIFREGMSSNFSRFFFFMSMRTITFVRLFYRFEHGLTEATGHKPKDRPCSIRAVKSPSGRLP
jgi:hypothetical protein